MKITAGQLRAARAFLRWTAQDVAEVARLGVATVRRAELQDGPLGITAANEDAIRRALEAAGVEFRPDGFVGCVRDASDVAIGTAAQVGGEVITAEHTIEAKRKSS